ncbi:hypothetical protein CCHOA_07495 [Corynebacterium choanae]|uniref:Uncharacterized protein n=1 Tax=Corynebacterium choanae TaxID=1862358 RepID=A0A3G6J6Z7_9CORY|nr:hypothetical protein CCHOA_07495 [Corynebacterium choanae]
MRAHQADENRVTAAVRKISPAHTQQDDQLALIGKSSSPKDDVGMVATE